MNETTAKKPAKTPAKKVPRKVTKDRLRNIALYHLERYATSAVNLKRVLERRVFKASRHHETDLVQAKNWIDEVVDALVRSGAVDDLRYAEGKAISMTRRGQSPAKVRTYLASKGINRETIATALQSSEEALGDPEWLAAQTYAQRRRIGPYRRADLSEEIRQKELAALGRAGFRYDIAKRIVDAMSESDLET